MDAPFMDDAVDEVAESVCFGVGERPGRMAEHESHVAGCCVNGAGVRVVVFFGKHRHVAGQPW